jgi:hypothetical protein
MKKEYTKPEIIFETDLEVKAGSPGEGVDFWTPEEDLW